ncbi:cytidine deaminase [Meiothermus sp. QL-1]|uniref:cytidine deaminase n=1 Tax=Meiothermus sp. QL-1 TaxID=2058095 RepID=UPI000E0A7FD0|nr:cytidine deaminase [Meiothermus sp. QL-1]RDI94647.1 cytidine deaminase [Meiothermus sp. QL-1]
MQAPPEVLRLLQNLLEHAYAPYSGYPVAAVVRSSRGNLYGGVNVENAAYPLSRCAEQAAVLQMVSAGEREIAEVWVLSRGEAPATPCGGCRQVLSEFAPPWAPVHCLSTGGGELHTTLGQLLPHAFSRNHLR